MSFIKALVPGTLFTWFIAIILGRNHARGGFLNVHLTELAGYEFYWSWPLFVASTGLAWLLYWVME